MHIAMPGETSLYQVGRIRFPLKAAANLQSRQKGQVMTIVFKKVSERFRRAGPSQRKRLLKIDDRFVGHWQHFHKPTDPDAREKPPRSRGFLDSGVQTNWGI